jgi:hypothetical protein
MWQIGHYGLRRDRIATRVWQRRFTTPDVGGLSGFLLSRRLYNLQFAFRNCGFRIQLIHCRPSRSARLNSSLLPLNL